VFLWVAVDVGDQVVEVAFGGDGDAAKRPLKQRPRPSIAVIKSAGVGVEEVGEELMRPVGLRILSICSSMCSPLDLTGLGGVWSCCVFMPVSSEEILPKKDFFLVKKRSNSVDPGRIFF
jgi:hypothetical protein